MKDKDKSRFLSLVLRHEPEKIGVELDPHGWINVQMLLEHLPFPMSREDLNTIVETSDKRRFAFSEDGLRIRANQGHSVEVDLDYAPQSPPAVLYHGTATKNLRAICADGLTRQSRHHVHLSTTPDTARAVGTRHGHPVILSVDAAKMAVEGHIFYLSANGVWLTDAVPANFLTSRELLWKLARIDMRRGMYIHNDDSADQVSNFLNGMLCASEVDTREIKRHVDQLPQIPVNPFSWDGAIRYHCKEQGIEESVCIDMLFDTLFDFLIKKSGEKGA